MYKRNVHYIDINENRRNIMVGYNMGTVESSFADLVWENEPLSTSELVALCKDKFNWKRTTTYTVLKRLIPSVPVRF